MINSRKLGYPADVLKGLPAREEFNAFKGFFGNCLFIAIIVGCFAVQFAIVYLGGRFLRVDALELKYQLFALGLGFSMLPWNLVCKLVPSSWFACLASSKEEPKLVNTNTRSRAFSRSMRNYVFKKIQQEKRQMKMRKAMHTFVMKKVTTEQENEEKKALLKMQNSNMN